MLRVAITLFVLFLAGCGSSGPAVGTVSGTITFDGKPLANATIAFAPEQAGRNSFAVTDENGRYQLMYTVNAPGAEIGEHRVTISSHRVNEEATKDPLLPAVYNRDSKLRATVKPGSNLIDYQLTSGGAIPEG